MGDFGISRVLQFTQDMAQTAVGTPLYVAPEVVKGVSYDAKAARLVDGLYVLRDLTLTSSFHRLQSFRSHREGEGAGPVHRLSSSVGVGV